MNSRAATVNEYLNEMPSDRKKAINELRKVILKNLPKGFREEMNYGMIGYVVPHSIYAPGYHCNPKLPLPFMNVASQNFQRKVITRYSLFIHTRKEPLAIADGCRYWRQPRLNARPDAIQRYGRFPSSIDGPRLRLKCLVTIPGSSFLWYR